MSTKVTGQLAPPLWPPTVGAWVRVSLSLICDRLCSSSARRWAAAEVDGQVRRRKDDDWMTYLVVLVQLQRCCHGYEFPPLSLHGLPAGRDGLGERGRTECSEEEGSVDLWSYILSVTTDHEGDTAMAANLGGLPFG